LTRINKSKTPDLKKSGVFYTDKRFSCGEKKTAGENKIYLREDSF